MESAEFVTLWFLMSISQLNSMNCNRRRATRKRRNRAKQADRKSEQMRKVGFVPFLKINCNCLVFVCLVDFRLTGVHEVTSESGDIFSFDDRGKPYHESSNRKATRIEVENRLLFPPPSQRVRHARLFCFVPGKKAARDRIVNAWDGQKRNWNESRDTNVNNNIWQLWQILKTPKKTRKKVIHLAIFQVETLLLSNAKTSRLSLQWTNLERVLPQLTRFNPNQLVVIKNQNSNANDWNHGDAV